MIKIPPAYKDSMASVDTFTLYPEGDDRTKLFDNPIFCIVTGRKYGRIARQRTANELANVQPPSLAAKLLTNRNK